MAKKRFNPFSGTLDFDSGTAATPSDSAKEIIINVEYGEAISALKLIYIASDGKAYRATSDDVYEKSLVVGITKTAGASGTFHDALSFGRIADASFTYSGSQDLYLTTLGGISNIAPATGFVAFIGKSINTGAIFINIKHVIT